MPFSFRTARKTAHLAPFALLLAITLGLTACSRVGLAYRNLDLLIPWSLNDYLSMTDSQRTDFDAQLDEHLRWHCVQQLPRYRLWVASAREMTAGPQISEVELAARFDEAKTAIDEIARRIAPSTVQMLRDLDEDQIAELGAALDKDISERRKKYVETPVEEQIEERAKRMEKRLAPWYGKLSAGQKARVLAWSRSLGANNSEWIENRALWQNTLKAALARRDASDFEQRIADLLQRRQQQWTPEYRQIFADAERAARDLLVDVHQQSTPEQRQRLQARLSDLQKELAEIRCTE